MNGWCAAESHSYTEPKPNQNQKKTPFNSNLYMHSHTANTLACSAYTLPKKKEPCAPNEILREPIFFFCICFGLIFFISLHVRSLEIENMYTFMYVLSFCSFLFFSVFVFFFFKLFIEPWPQPFYTHTDTLATEWLCVRSVLIWTWMSEEARRDLKEIDREVVEIYTHRHLDRFDGETKPKPSRKKIK